MRRVRFHAHGGPEVLVLESAPDPEPGPGELLVRVEAIGVTLPSVRATRNPATPLPGVLGGEEKVEFVQSLGRTRSSSVPSRSRSRSTWRSTPWAGTCCPGSSARSYRAGG